MLENLRLTVERLHNCKAAFREIVSVREEFESEPVWEGNVYVFDIEGHPTATRAYVWSSPIEGSDNRKFYAVLHEGPIKSPADAVKAAIVKDYQESPPDITVPYLKAIEHGEYDDPKLAKKFRLAIIQQHKDGVLTQAQFVKISQALTDRHLRGKL